MKEITEDARIQELLARQAAGEEISPAEWGCAIADWITSGWSPEKWDDFVERGLSWIEFYGEITATERLGLRLVWRDVAQHIHWRMMSAYAEARHLSLEEYLRFVRRYGGGTTSRTADPCCSYEQYGMDDEGGVDKDNPIITHIYVVGLPAPRHLSPTGELWLLKEEDHDGRHWILPPHPTREAAVAAARTRAMVLDGSQLC
jgi:hypothetical protein